MELATAAEQQQQSSSSSLSCLRSLLYGISAISRYFRIYVIERKTLTAITKEYEVKKKIFETKFRDATTKRQLQVDKLNLLSQAYVENTIKNHPYSWPSKAQDEKMIDIATSEFNEVATRCMQLKASVSILQLENEDEESRELLRTIECKDLVHPPTSSATSASIVQEKLQAKVNKIASTKQTFATTKYAWEKTALKSSEILQKLEQGSLYSRGIDDEFALPSSNDTSKDFVSNLPQGFADEIRRGIQQKTIIEEQKREMSRQADERRVQMKREIDAEEIEDEEEEEEEEDEEKKELYFHDMDSRSRNRIRPDVLPIDST